MPKKRQPDGDAARLLGGLLRDLRKAAGYRAVKDALATPGFPAAQQTIYAYERGGLVPNLQQFLELTEFYALKAPGATDRTRYMAVAAIHRALASPGYGVREAFELIERLQPAPSPGRKRRST